MKISDVTDNTFTTEVLESETPVLVDFWAPWCGPCRMVAPVLEEIANEREDIRIVKLNIDDHPARAAELNVMRIPTMILFKAGEPAVRIEGATRRKKDLLARLEPALA